MDAKSSAVMFRRKSTATPHFFRRALLAATVTALFAAIPAQGGTYNPTASDSTNNTAGGTNALPSSSGSDQNTAFGSGSMQHNTHGEGNTASGYQSLNTNTEGSYNTSIGQYSLLNNTTGSSNTAVGLGALKLNTTGGGNTASGVGAVSNNTTGMMNTAAGYTALTSNTTGSYNVANGFDALLSSTTASYNTANGYDSLYKSNGSYNVATGAGALYNDTSGYLNSATGFYSTYANTTGLENVAEGPYSLYSNSTGSNNIGIGTFGGFYLTTGNYNIDIGNQGTAGDANTIRIGDSNQGKTFISGIAGVTLAGGGSQVVINSSGQLGVIASSARYKQDIADMADDSSKLFDLRPVTFHYISDPTQEKQYGLIAEEVDKVYPDLVVRNPQGEIESVRYYELSPMLLNELQKQHREMQVQKDTIAAQAQQLQQQKKAIDTLMLRMAKLEALATAH